MSRLQIHREYNKSSSALLLTGVWSKPLPLLRFREYYICQVFQHNYKKKLYISMLKLKENHRSRHFNRVQILI